MEELAYAQRPPLLDGQRPPSPPVREEAGHEKTLPPWARAFPRMGGGSGPGVNTARSGAALQPPGASQEFQWTAPGALPSAANVVFREKEHPRQERPTTPAMSDGELRRTADKVYRLIEDRIRRECRRIGL